MNSMVGGTDVILKTARQGFELGPLLDAVTEVWPDALFQDVDEEGLRPLSAVLQDQHMCDSHEFFVYRDRASADSWKKNGWTEEHANAMAHFLVSEVAKRPEILQLTLVVGSVTGETVPLISAVKNVVSSRGDAVMKLYGDGLDSLRFFLEAMAKAEKIDWLGNPEPYTRDLPDSHPDKVKKPEDLIDIWRRSLAKPGIGQVPPTDKPQH